MFADQYPKLRPLEALPCERNGERFVLLHDPSQIGAETLIIAPELYVVLSLFNGKNSILDIQAEVTRYTGQLIYREKLEELVLQLDSAYFLDNENAQNRRRQVTARYRAEPIRKAHHAGGSYPNDANELNRWLDALYDTPEGAGRPDLRANERRTTALIAPHIDLRLGGSVYTHAYRRLAESEPIDLFVILGTGHQGLPRCFSISKKDFSTPLGTVSADREVMNELDSTLPERMFAEDLSHRTEHSIEFQLIFLQHLLKTKDFRIVPILASFSFQDLNSENESNRLDEFRLFVDSLGEALTRVDRRICFIASVDFAHIGPRYGDRASPNALSVETVIGKDQQMLRPILRGKAEEFVAFVAGERDQRRICGFPCISTLLSLIPGTQGELLAHSHCEIDSLGSFVTYASIAY